MYRLVVLLSATAMAIVLLPNSGLARDKKDEEKPVVYKLKWGTFKSIPLELAPPVAHDISLRDMKREGNFVKFKLTWNSADNTPSGKYPWQFTAFDEEGSKLEGGEVMYRDNVRVGQTVVAEFHLDDDTIKDAARILIYYRK